VLQKKYSVCQITSSASIVNGEPREGGLADLRLGSSDRFVVCTTDGMDREEGCPGYFGHIELATPLYHIGFNRTVLKVLRCVGYHSSKLLLDPSNDKDAAALAVLRNTHMGSTRLDRAMRVCQGKKTDFNSGAPQPRYKMDPKEHIAIKAEFPRPKQNDMDDGPEVKAEREQVRTALLAQQHTCAPYRPR
jgi:DNA-directed RNA polymerase II subunit RPB1